MDSTVAKNRQKEHPFSQFLETWVPAFARKSRQLNQAYWILETTGSKDAAMLRADLDTELRLLASSPDIYRQLLDWDREGSVNDPLLQRQLNVLIRTFLPNQIPAQLLQEMAEKEAELAECYASFRAQWQGKSLSENEIRECLKNESHVETRKGVWAASKEIGRLLAPKIIELVQLRNQAARAVGYSDYFQMQLDLQEVDDAMLQRMFKEVAEGSDAAYREVLSEIEAQQMKQFGVSRDALGPWAWGDPFCQEDPLSLTELDRWVEGLDLVEASRHLYRKMGMNVDTILANSDLYERKGKSQHAFCMHMDRKGDIRTLNNVCSTIKWLETLLHELGHAVYELGFDPALPWLLAAPPHMIPTEAMALLAGRQAYLGDSLKLLLNTRPLSFDLGQRSLRRRQLIFSRWVFVMTAFERELYRDPFQSLNVLWWKLVETYQHVQAPRGRENAQDWAAKYHIGLAPVYYFSYLLGELFASAIQERVTQVHGKKVVYASFEMGQFLQERLFAPGDRFSWSQLVERVVGEPLQARAWLREFAFLQEHRQDEQKNRVP